MQFEIFMLLLFCEFKKMAYTSLLRDILLIYYLILIMIERGEIEKTNLF